VNLTVPNLLSILRMGLIPLFVVSVLDGRPGRALLVFAIAGITDALDGAIARFLDQRSALGAYLDPAADKLLLMTAYVVLAIPGLHPRQVIPAWVTALVLTRDVVIIVVAVVLYLASGITSFPPTVISKINTAAQVAAVILVLLSGVAAGFEIPATIAVFAVAGLTLASGIDYIWRANRMAANR
jgi:cardiolipin synthase